MLQTTSAQLLEQARKGGSTANMQPVRVGASRQQGQALTGTQLFAVPKGQVLLMTEFVQQLGGHGGGALGAYNPSPSPSEAAGGTVGGFRYFKAGGTPTYTAQFSSFLRKNSVHDNSAAPTPNWRNAQPDSVVKYKPKYAVPIPSGHFLYSSTTLGGDFGNSTSAYGVLVDENTARQLGYAVNDSATDADRRIGVKSFVADGTLSGRAGQSIRILDIHVRMQPQQDRAAAGAPSTIEIKQLGDVRVLHKFVNNNQGDFVDVQFSPADCWFLGQGYDLQVDFTGTDIGSVTILYEYVDADEVPKDVFWGSRTPTLPSPGLATTAVYNPAVSSAINLYWPGKYNSDPTPAVADYNYATPGQGSNYILYGYAVSAQTVPGSGEGSVTNADQTLLTLSSGDSAGAIDAAFGGSPGGSRAQSNYQLAPVFQLNTTDQVLNAVVDDLALPCEPNYGRIWVDMAGYGPATGLLSALTTPANTNNGIDALQVSVWGRADIDITTTPNNEGV